MREVRLAEIGNCVFEALQGLGLGPPIRKPFNIEDGVFVGRQRNIEDDRCEIEIGETQITSDEG